MLYMSADKVFTRKKNNNQLGRLAHSRELRNSSCCVLVLLLFVYIKSHYYSTTFLYRQLQERIRGTPEMLILRFILPVGLVHIVRNFAGT